MDSKLSTLITKYPFYFILLVIFIVSVFQLGSWGITETSEARYVQIAKEMYDSGDYIHPTKMGIYHYHKPPFAYYITTLGYALFGINEFGARFFLIIALLMQLFFTYKTSFLLFNNKKTALLSAILFFSTPLILASIRNLTTDAYLNTFILMAIYFWLRYLEDKKFFFLFYLALSFGFFTKGPLVFIPVLVFQLTWFYYNQIRIRLTIYDFTGIILILLSSGWWYLTIIQENPFVLDYFMGNQLYGRMASNDAFNRGKPFWYYFIYLPLSLFPWIVYFIFALLKTKKKETNSLNKKILITSFVLIILIFSAFKTKLIFYVLPALLFLILYASNQLMELSEKQWKIFTHYLYAYFFLLFIIALAAIVLHKIECNPYSILILFLGLVISIFGIQNTSWFYKNVYTLLINTLTLVLFSTYVMKSNELLINSAKPISTFVNTLKSNNVYIYNYLLPSMSFYTNKNIITINNGNYTSKREVQFEQNLNYLKNYYNLEEKKEKERFKTEFKTQNGIFLARKKENLPDYIKIKVSQYRHKKYFGNWTLYYN